MQGPDAGGQALTPEESWRTIHATMDEGRSSLYTAGAAAILLLWGAIVSFGYLLQYAIETLAPGFAGDNPWFPGPVWGVLAAAGMLGSAIIGHRAGRKNAVGGGARSVGIRVFFFWLAVVAAAFLIPAASGMWTEGAVANIPGVAIGVVSLGCILFGIMHRPAIAVVGAGFAAAFYIPSHLAGDLAPAPAVSAAAVAALGAVWVRKSGVA